MGTHNIKVGYQLNRLSNDIAQRYNVPGLPNRYQASRTIRLGLRFSF